jgi:nitrite reductase (NADH) small subunit
MAHWIRIASVHDCPPGSARELLAGQRIVALFNVDGQFFALDGLCPHQGGPLGRGTLCGARVCCPWHGWQFDVRTGQHGASPQLCHTTLPLRQEGDDLFVDVTE